MISKSLTWMAVVSLLFLLSWTPPTTDYSKILSGRYVMVHAHCAGFNFINKKVVLWTNEIDCNNPDTLMIRWLDTRTFMTKTTVRVKADCPPMVDIYKVISFDGRLLTLKRIWTGWSEKNEKDQGDYELKLVRKA